MAISSAAIEEISNGLRTLFRMLGNLTKGAGPRLIHSEVRSSLKKAIHNARIIVDGKIYQYERLSEELKAMIDISSDVTYRTCINYYNMHKDDDAHKHDGKFHIDAAELGESIYLAISSHGISQFYDDHRGMVGKKFSPIYEKLLKAYVLEAVNEAIAVIDEAMKNSRR
jgi:hypothetical protein